MNSIYTPPPSGLQPEPDKPSEDNGSLGAGIGLAWAIAVVGTPLSVAMTAALNTRFSAPVLALWLLPYLLIIGLAIFQYRKGKTRTGLGLMLGLLSMIAVALLLVAACFGMLSNLNPH